MLANTDIRRHCESDAICEVSRKGGREVPVLLLGNTMHVEEAAASRSHEGGPVVVLPVAPDVLWESLPSRARSMPYAAAVCTLPIDEGGRSILLRRLSWGESQP